MTGETKAAYPVDETNRLKRRHDRGFYDHPTVHALLDSAALCHVAYVIDGQPYCTPTLFWREGTRLYWHGSSASRMLRNLSEAQARLSHGDAARRLRAGAIRLQSFHRLSLGHGVRTCAAAGRWRGKRNARSP